MVSGWLMLGCKKCKQKLQKRCNGIWHCRWWKFKVLWVPTVATCKIYLLYYFWRFWQSLLWFLDLLGGSRLKVQQISRENILQEEVPYSGKILARFLVWWFGGLEEDRQINIKPRSAVLVLKERYLYTPQTLGTPLSLGIGNGVANESMGRTGGSKSRPYMLQGVSPWKPSKVLTQVHTRGEGEDGEPSKVNKHFSLLLDA